MQHQSPQDLNPSIERMCPGKPGPPLLSNGFSAAEGARPREASADDRATQEKQLDIYYMWRNLKPGVQGLEFVESVREYLDHLREKHEIEARF